MARQRKSQVEREQAVWDYFVEKPNRDFFKDITITPDGGFSEVLELWRPSRWFTALITVLFLLMNLYYTFLIDMLLLKKSSDKELQLPMISRGLFQKVANWLFRFLGQDPPVVKADKCVAAIELILTTQMLLHMVYCSMMAMISADGFQKWSNAERVWWSQIPKLYSYSAMRLLHFVSPQVLPIHFSKFLYNFGTWKRIQFIVLRTLALVIGFDAFMLKCRESRDFMEGGSDRSTIATLWAGFVFLRQVLGVVQVSFEVQDRVFSFMFAGEDGIMQENEICKKVVWKAMLVSEVFKQFRKKDGYRLGKAKAVALMLSFDDTDFQKLFLDQRSPGPVKSALAQDSSSCSEDDDESGSTEDDKP
mmetsp:Transcript_62416/g.145274  ORF Transcript_62416/g.145274 Transcript_62416/m.145274 type:complete len:362 (+) Transcript_62416:55-1140(+)